MDTEILKLRLYQGLSEDLRKWFKDGGWNRYNTKGEKVGKCARDDKDGDGKADGPKPKCLPASKAASLGKKKVAAAVKRKRAEDPNPERTGAAKNVSTESVVHEMISTSMSGRKYKSIDNPEDQARLKKEDDRKKVAKDRAGKARKEELAATRQTKGIKFYDKKGSGYMKDGKKVYEGTEELQQFMEACWKGYEKKGMKTMFGKRYPNCVKKEEVELDERSRLDGPEERKKDLDKRYDPKGGGTNPFQYRPGKEEKTVKKESFQSFNEKAQKCWDTHKKVGMKMKGGKLVNDCRPKSEVSENVSGGRSRLAKSGRVQGKTVGDVTNAEKSKSAEALKAQAKSKDKAAADKVDVSGMSPFDAAIAKKRAERKAEKERLKASGFKRMKREEVEVQSEGAAWTKKSGKNESGGLNEKGRKSYERENPGSDLKRPSKKVGNKRRASFCARMKGMRKRQKPSNNTGEDRLSKSLRAWNC